MHFSRALLTEIRLGEPVEKMDDMRWGTIVIGCGGNKPNRYLSAPGVVT